MPCDDAIFHKVVELPHEKRGIEASSKGKTRRMDRRRGSRVNAHQHLDALPIMTLHRFSRQAFVQASANVTSPKSCRKSKPAS